MADPGTATPAGVTSLPRAGARWGPEHVFAGLVALFGLAFAFGLPPVMVPDEPSHFYRAFHVSEGRPLPRKAGGWGGAVLPASLTRLCDSFAHLAFHPERKARWADFQDVLGVPLEPGARTFVGYPGAAYNSFLPYAPQALGVAAARWCGLGVLGVFYAGRLANLGFAVLLVYLAVRTSPVFKLVLGTVACLPVTVQQFASHSPDASTIGVALLLVAVLLRLAAGAPGRLGAAGLLSLYGLAGWLALCKFPYAGLALFYLAVPAARVGSRRKYLLVGAGLALVTLAVAAGSARLHQRYVPESHDFLGYEASPAKQVEAIRARPQRFLRACVLTAVDQGKDWLDMLARLGWLDTPVHPLAVQALLVLLAVVGLWDRTEGLPLSGRVKVAGLLAAAACAGLVLASLYLWWTPVGAAFVCGIQGRYFVPLLPLLLLPLSARAVRVQAHPRLLLAVTAAGCAAVLVVSVTAFVCRYYRPAPAAQRATAWALGAGLALVTVTAIAAGRRYRAEG